MIPVDFPEKNHTLGPPPGVSRDECMDLHTYTDIRTSLSCWQFTDEELLELFEKRILYIRIWAMNFHPPIMVFGKNPFVKLRNGNFVLNPEIPNTPPEMNTADVWTDGQTSISLWGFTEEEILEMYKTRKVYIRIWSGKGSQHPMMVYAFSPFEPPAVLEEAAAH